MGCGHGTSTSQTLFPKNQSPSPKSRDLVRRKDGRGGEMHANTCPSKSGSRKDTSCGTNGLRNVGEYEPNEEHETSLFEKNVWLVNTRLDAELEEKLKLRPNK